jgi:hypothetical protein
MILPKNKILSFMRSHLGDVRDNRTGEINHTLLAEMAANELNLYLNDNYDIPEEVFELATKFN